MLTIDKVRTVLIAAEDDERLALSVQRTCHHLTRTIGGIKFVVGDAHFALGLTHNQYWLGLSSKSPGPSSLPESKLRFADGDSAFHEE